MLPRSHFKRVSRGQGFYFLGIPGSAERIVRPEQVGIVPIEGSSSNDGFGPVIRQAEGWRFAFPALHHKGAKVGKVVQYEQPIFNGPPATLLRSQRGGVHARNQLQKRLPTVSTEPSEIFQSIAAQANHCGVGPEVRCLNHQRRGCQVMPSPVEDRQSAQAEPVDQSDQAPPVPEAKLDVQEDTLLTESERQELESCERHIGHLREAAFLSGSSLKTIQEKRLYREEYRTFERYCEAKLKMSAQNAYRLIDAAKIITVIQESHQFGDENLPNCESHVRPLADGLVEDQWLNAWQQVIEEADGDQVTGTLVKKVVNKITGNKTRKTKPKAGKPPKGLKSVLSLVERAKSKAEKDKQKRLVTLLGKIQSKINAYLRSLKS
jgi:hypothetical protein